MKSRDALRDSSQTQINSSQAARTGKSKPASPPMQAEPPAQPDPPVNPFAPDDGRYVSKEEYWARWYENPYPDIDVSYEWNNGRLEAKPLPNEPQLDLYNWFLDLLRRFISTYPIAKLINLETGFVLTIADPAEPSGPARGGAQAGHRRDPEQQPGTVGRHRPAPFRGRLRHGRGGGLRIPRRAEALRDTEEKRRDYALAGVKEYYILDPGNEHMRFYRLTPGGQYEALQPDAEDVIGSELLPGLQFRMEDLERQPDLVELALDDVYSGYVIPDLQIAVTKAAAEAQRADAEAAARQEAEKRAEEEAAARREADERMQAMADELARLRRQSS